MQTSPLNILIIGYGFVGKAVEHSFMADYARRNLFKIHIIDPAQGFPEDAAQIDKMDVVFICVPSPQMDTGECDDSLVLYYTFKLRDVKCPVIVKSTIPPTTIEHLLVIKPDIVYMPEFLREKHWQEDSVKPFAVVIGTTDDKMAARVHDIMRMSCINFNGIRVIQSSPIEASIMKYTINTFLAMKVVYMNQLHEWMSSRGYAQGLGWQSLTELLKLEPRLGGTHFDVPGDHGFGYSGTCFPKDVSAFVLETGGKMTLLEEAQEANKRLRGEL